MGIGRSIARRSSLSSGGYDSTPSYNTPLAGPNPDPFKFRITKIREFGTGNRKYSAAMITYEGCTNYEGKKVLVLRGSQDEIMELKSLDPHFAKNGRVIARFVPDETGWTYALKLAKDLDSGSVNSR